MEYLARCFAVSVSLVFVWFFGCGTESDPIEPNTSDTSAANGGIYSPACNDGAPDGYCNALGADPETCECLDCFGTAVCEGGCTDNGTCDGDEDCTCDDCFGQFEDCSGGENNGNNNNNGPNTSAPSSSNTTGMGGGGGATTATTGMGGGGGATTATTGVGGAGGA